VIKRDGLFVDGPGEEAAVIFYPRAKVKYTTYLPLFYGLASREWIVTSLKYCVISQFWDRIRQRIL